ncbi:MAG: hypothetical protein KDC12_00565 [Flavobacteriales bacterium]|nr:hypothetical protein [Flavobacteriales bacterium]
MRLSLYLLMLMLALAGCMQDHAHTDSPKEQEAAAVPATAFDSLRAAKWGADEYGMKKYVMAFLKKGPNRDRSPEEANELQRAHLDNIGRMAEEGKLVLAGPFFGDGELRGIYIFNVETIAEAEALTQSDPAIQAGSLAMDLMEWYGSAALVDVNEWHSRISRMNP